MKNLILLARAFPCLMIKLLGEAVFKCKMKWHEIGGGRFQFSYPQGALSERQEGKIQSNLDLSQGKFDIKKEVP